MLLNLHHGPYLCQCQQSSMAIKLETAGGTLEGRAERGVEVFRGIPYAAPPVGSLRFCAPEPIAPWYGSRPALDFGPSAPQVGPISRLVRTMIGVGGGAQSQDCLYLNVWTPGAGPSSRAKRRPVMVWIHGGAFILGSGSSRLYSGARLAQRGDVVVVTINYRLGALGFLTWDSLCGETGRPPANAGLLDQLAALEWVRDNIEEFGGDPDNVTLFGESAGGMSVGTLLGTPRARGLFHKAVLQSGAAHNCSSPARAERISQQFVSELQIESPTPEKLGELPVGEIMRAQAITSAKVGLVEGTLAWQPSVDGELVPEQPLAAIARGLSADVPTLVGSNRDEWKLFMTGDRAGRNLDEPQLGERMRRALPGKNAEGDAVADLATEAYRCVGGPRGREPAERWTAFQSDRVFHYPATRLAELQSRHQPNTYAYLFEWAPALVGSGRPRWWVSASAPVTAPSSPLCSGASGRLSCARPLAPPPRCKIYATIFKTPGWPLRATARPSTLGCRNGPAFRRSAGSPWRSRAGASCAPIRTRAPGISGSR